MTFWISSGAQRSPHTSNGQLWYYLGFNIDDQIHPNPFESIKIQPNPPRFGSAFSRPHGTAFHSEEPSIRDGLSIRTASLRKEWPSLRKYLPVETGFHSEWLRYNPKGPRGPIPPHGRRRRPSVPLGTLGFPWVPLGPPQGIGTLLKRRKGVSRVWWRSGFTGERILGRRHARKRIWI